ncbi:hypothetical protein EAO69_41980 [Streptomyces sp. me109]|nr:hypothetical protein EAO69_41980 [Streptomyces sp. me109]
MRARTQRGTARSGVSARPAFEDEAVQADAGVRGRRPPVRRRTSRPISAGPGGSHPAHWNA